MTKIGSTGSVSLTFACIPYNFVEILMDEGNYIAHSGIFGLISRSHSGSRVYAMKHAVEWLLSKNLGKQAGWSRRLVQRDMSVLQMHPRPIHFQSWSEGWFLSNQQCWLPAALCAQQIAWLTALLTLLNEGNDHLLICLQWEHRVQLLRQWSWELQIMSPWLISCQAAVARDRSIHHMKLV